MAFHVNRKKTWKPYLWMAFVWSKLLFAMKTDLLLVLLSLFPCDMAYSYDYCQHIRNTVYCWVLGAGSRHFISYYKHYSVIMIWLWKSINSLICFHITKNLWSCLLRSIREVSSWFNVKPSTVAQASSCSENSKQWQYQSLSWLHRMWGGFGGGGGVPAENWQLYLFREQ